MILGDRCTRDCRFCDVLPGQSEAPDDAESQRVAEAVRLLGLRHAVITSVTRDDLDDGGAGLWAETIRSIRRLNPACCIEILIPDFLGNTNALQQVLEAQPDIVGHNVETVPRLYSEARPQANYRRSLDILRRAKAAGFTTKSGLMLGMGETVDEVRAVMQDLRAVHCDILTLGQYLQPTNAHVPIARYWTPEEFQQLQREGEESGFTHVEAGPLVRSSYHADLVVGR
jgi:lipoic acid synthetase